MDSVLRIMAHCCMAVALNCGQLCTADVAIVVDEAVRHAGSVLISRAENENAFSDSVLKPHGQKSINCEQLCAADVAIVGYVGASVTGA